MNQSWHEYYSEIAKLVATKSKDTTKVGAVLVGNNGEILLTAFNGPPKGVLDSQERFKKPQKYLYASHAEQNLIAFAARNGIATEGLSLFLTHYPCASCAKTLIQAGIKRIYYTKGKVKGDWAEDFKVSKTMFHEAVLEVVEL